MPAHFTLTTDHAGEFRSTLQGGNGEIVATSEGYTNRATAKRFATDLLRWTVEANTQVVAQAVCDAMHTAGFADGASMAAVADNVIESLTKPS